MVIGMSNIKCRLFYIIIDQLAGHWADNVFVHDNIPPANVLGYVERKFLPNFEYIIRNGVWVKRPWNRGTCDTLHGMKYLCTGSYDMNIEVGFFEYLTIKYKVNCAVFTTSPWGKRGYFYIPGYMVSLPGYYAPYYDDYLVWKLFVMPYLESNENWEALHFYMAINDMVSHCPSYQKTNPHVKSSKHAYLIYLDKLLGEIVSFLKVKGYWDDTLLVVASDHGYHLGCSVARGMGVTTANWCCDHPAPYDCEVWDFEKDKSTGIYSGGPRRITFILSGGAISDYKGLIIEEAEIIDVIPTIAKILGVEYKAEGKSII